MATTASDQQDNKIVGSQGRLRIEPLYHEYAGPDVVRAYRADGDECPCCGEDDE